MISSELSTQAWSVLSKSDHWSQFLGRYFEDSMVLQRLGDSASYLDSGSINNPSVL